MSELTVRVERENHFSVGTLSYMTYFRFTFSFIINTAEAIAELYNSSYNGVISGFLRKTNFART